MPEGLEVGPRIGGLLGVRRAVVLILACACVRAAAADEIPPARDLPGEARTASAAGIPLVVLFTQPDCTYCERVRRDYLRAMAAQGTVRVVEVDITSDAPLGGFDSRPLTHASFARGERVRVTPTLAFFGTGGEALAPPLVGFTSPDFYQSYLERRIDDAREHLARARRAP
jgi:thioredoxin-related protein